MSRAGFEKSHLQGEEIPMTRKDAIAALANHLARYTPYTREDDDGTWFDEFYELLEKAPADVVARAERRVKLIDAERED
jgi:hypothetical protein